MGHHAPPPQPDDPVTAHAEPRWFKGNLHTHSLWSDGNDYPEMIVDWYARHGYQFLALSDHNVLGQGQKWLSIAQADRRAKADGFERYRKRFVDPAFRPLVKELDAIIAAAWDAYRHSRKAPVVDPKPK